MLTDRCAIRRFRLYFVAVAIVTGVSLPLSKACTELEFQCGTGDCIPIENLCDGSPHCTDRSDETADACIKQTCPPFAFRCAYGACVPGQAECNRTIECADRSDELTNRCKQKRIIRNSLCLEFQCTSGECISRDNVCDGVANCSDQSDENEDECASMPCPSTYFRCGYGACIDASKRCDGRQNCNDGSDEATSLCGIKKNVQYTPNRSNKPYVLTQTHGASNLSCTAPILKNSRLIRDGPVRSVILPGEEVPDMSSVIYECQRGYNLEGMSSNLCYNGLWFSTNHPSCTRYCRHESLTGVTFNARCVRNHVTVRCNDRIRPGTTALISCPTKYKIPERNPPQSLVCDEEGQWDYTPSRCEPVCGEELTRSVPFLTNAEITNVTMVPWHVAIYKRVETYKYSCGGTILNAKVIISAAHCFWDQENQGLFDSSLYLVGAGKNKREIGTHEPSVVQYVNVSRIVIPTEYNDAVGRFKADVAIVVLTNPLIFSEFISPVCVHWKKDAAKGFVDGVYGQVAGWGVDENNELSEDLKTIQVPGSAYSTCQREVGPQYADAITDEKFCVLNKYNTNACRGDSGGGFVVKSGTGGKTRFYLWGIVSTGVPYGNTCNNFDFVTFTNIQFYEGFIADLEARNRPK